jgi:anti-sigma factor RsiW
VGRCVTAKTLSRYMDGDLPSETVRDVDAHVAQCAVCRQTLAEMRAMDEAVRQSAVVPGEVPDVAAGVTAELRRRGAFWRARVTTGKRRIFGEGNGWLPTGIALMAAASLAVAILGGMDWLTRDAWNRRTAPVVADAERVLVRLVRMDSPADGQARMVWARQEARKLALPDRLAEARQGASPAFSSDLAYLQTAFAMLAREEPLPSALQDQLKDGDALQRAVRLREVLQRKS